MAIAIVQTKTGTSTGSNSTTVTFDAATVAGNLIVACVSTTQSSLSRSTTTPTDFTAAVSMASVTAPACDSFIYYRENAPATTSVTITASGTVGFIVTLFEISGAKTSAALDKISSNTNTGTSMSTSGTGTLTESDQIGIAVFTRAGTTAGTTWTGGETEVHDAGLGAGYYAGGHAYEMLATTASFQGAANQSGSVEYTGVVATFMSAPVITGNMTMCSD